MKDTKNLIKKRDIIYPKLIREAEIKKDQYMVDFWKKRIEDVSETIELRNKNRKKNEKKRK